MKINISGYCVIIDNEDYSRIKELKYFVNKAQIKNSGLYYFSRNIYIDEKRTGTTLHRDIMGCIKGDGKIVDHINGNTLDCRKENLRLCTSVENSRNCKTYKGVKGVNWRKDTGKWRAMISVNGKEKSLGNYNYIEEAKEAYCEASKKYHGEYGRVQ